MSFTVKAYYKHGHGAQPIVVTSSEEMDALIDAVLAEEFGNSVVALYVSERPRMKTGHPDHELRLAIDREAKAGGIRYAGGDSKGSWYALGRTSKREEVFYYYQGHDEGWPRDSEVSLNMVRMVAKDFLASGGSRPALVHWQAWPADVG